MLVARRAIAGTALAAALLATGVLAAAPSVSDAPARAKQRYTTAPRAIGAFTPATADPRLAAALARAGIGGGNFRFTPSEGRGDANRAITVAVRATRAGGDPTRLGLAAPAALSITPIAYNLGAAIGWKRFALSGDMSRVDLGAQPGSRESVDLGVSYVGDRASARVRAQSDRPLANTPRLGGELSTYSLDVGGSYSLTRNLDVTAGVRYKTDRDRLEQLREDRRDSQAVYLGTAFRF